MKFVVACFHFLVHKCLRWKLQTLPKSNQALINADEQDDDDDAEDVGL
jgi:hypothetical protein